MGATDDQALTVKGDRTGDGGLAGAVSRACSKLLSGTRLSVLEAGEYAVQSDFGVNKEFTRCGDLFSPENFDMYGVGLKCFLLHAEFGVPMEQFETWGTSE